MKIYSVDFTDVEGYHTDSFLFSPDFSFEEVKQWVIANYRKPMPEWSGFGTKAGWEELVKKYYANGTTLSEYEDQFKGFRYYDAFYSIQIGENELIEKPLINLC